MPVIKEEKPSIADRLADVFIDRDGKGSWLAIVFVTVVIAAVSMTLFNFVSDRFSVRTHNKEKEQILETASAEIDAKEKQIEVLQKNEAARLAELKWARNRERHHIEERERLENENKELTKLLNSRLPADLLR